MEANATGQMVDDVALTVKKIFDKNVPVYCNPHVYGVPAIGSIRKDFHRLVSGEIKEVY